MVDHVGYEITTYRTDGEYTDHRHPDSVQFVGRLQEDLMRRDFTINAMAADISGKIRDFYDGQFDWSISGFVVWVILISVLWKIHCVSLSCYEVSIQIGICNRAKHRRRRYA